MASNNNNNNPTSETLFVPEKGIGEFFVSDSVSTATAVPPEAREVAKSAPLDAVVVYVRPYGPQSTTMGEASASRRQGAPKLLWERIKEKLSGSWTKIGDLQQSLWALQPGDVLYVHTAGRKKFLECYTISRPNKERRLVATRVPSKFDREHNHEVGRFNAFFVEGGWREIEARKAREAAEQAEADRLRKANAERMKPVLETRVLAVSERRLAIGLGAITLGEEYFYYSEPMWNRFEYTEAEVVKAEAEVTEAETQNAEKLAFEARVLDLTPRMEMLGVVSYDDRGIFRAKAPGAQYSESFLPTATGLSELVSFVERVEEQVAIAKRAEVARQSAAELEKQRLLDEASRFQAIMLAHSQLPDDLKNVSSYDEASWTYSMIAGRNGVQLYQAYADRRYVSRVNPSRPFSEGCENRDAQVIYRVPCAGGALELLAFQKYGGWNLHMRWRERVEEVPQVVEVVQTPTEPEPQTVVGKVTTFADISGRWFQCGCGTTQRVSKGDASAYQACGTLELACSACGGHGSAKK